MQTVSYGRVWRAWTRFVVVVALATFATVAQAQSTTIWDARKLLSGTSESTVRLLERDREVARVDRGQVQRFVDVVDKIGSQFSIYPEVVLMKGEGPNAFATRKDGKPVVGVNLPMLRLTGTDPDLAAVVVGHEMAHLQLDHMDEGRKRQVAIGVLSIIAGAVAGYSVAKHGVNPAPVVELAALGGALTNRKFDRDQEREADDLGIKAMYQAGYDVHAAPRLWEEMQRTTTGGSGWWLSTHPAHTERIETLRQTAIALRPQGPQPTMVASAAPTLAVTPDVPANATPAPEARPTGAMTLVTSAGKTGSSAWCLAAADGSQAVCSYATWSECHDARPNASHRCLGRDSDLIQTAQPNQPASASAGVGDQVWCLADAEANPPRCQYATYEACAAAKPDDRYRCISGEPGYGVAAATAVGPSTPAGELVPPAAPAAIAPERGALPAATAAPESVTARRLRELLQLRRDGLITDAEYASKRKAILSEL